VENLEIVWTAALLYGRQRGLMRVHIKEARTIL